MKLYYLGLAFLNGSVVMALEISSTRLLAPYFGTSIFVWTNVIGVVLGALSLGYFIGGKLSEYKPSLEKLLKLTTLTGLLVLTIPWLIHPLARTILSQQIFDASTGVITFGSLLAIGILFGLPLMLLGITSPYLIKLSSERAEHMGDIAGKLFAISTLGSLLGTFLPTLVLIPQFGTRNTILGCGLILVLVGSLGFSKWTQTFSAGVSGLLIIALSLTQIAMPTNVLYSSESSYQKIEITEGVDGTRFLQFDAGFGIQSVYHPDKILTNFHYYDYYNVLPVLTGEQKNKILIIGLAAGTIARQLNYYYGTDVTIDGVEVDPKVIEASKEYLGLNNIPVNIINQDGRVFLAQTKNTYDIIIIDAYHNEFEIPWTLTTKEFWEDAREHLNPNGIVAMNIAASTRKTDLLDAFVRTGASVFEHVYVTPTGNEQQSVTNYMISMSTNSIPFSSLPNNKQNKLGSINTDIAATTREAVPKPDALLLTDDKAPIDILTAETFWPELRAHIR